MTLCSLKVAPLKRNEDADIRTSRSVSKRSTAIHFSETNATHHPSFGEAFRFWLKLGFISFGCPAHRATARKREANNRPFRRDRSSGRRRIELGGLVRDSCYLSRRENARLVRARAKRR